jgi:hypothetical protein
MEGLKRNDENQSIEKCVTLIPSMWK